MWGSNVFHRFARGTAQRNGQPFRGVATVAAVSVAKVGWAAAEALRTARSAHHVIVRSQSGSGRPDLVAVQDEFTKQAAWFERGWGVKCKLPTDEIMRWAMSAVVAGADGEATFRVNEAATPSSSVPATPKRWQLGLDVATGTGIFARSLATVCDSVAAIDATAAMLAEAPPESSGRGGVNGQHHPLKVLGDAVCAQNSIFAVRPEIIPLAHEVFSAFMFLNSACHTACHSTPNPPPHSHGHWHAHTSSHVLNQH
jgi:hypothetical protein